MLLPLALRRPARPFLGSLAILRFLARRLRADALLAALLAAGLTVAAALVASVPLFSDAVITLGLRQTLSAPADGKLPPSALLFHHISRGPGTALSPSDARRVDRFLEERVAGLLAVPVNRRVRMGQSERLSIFLGPPGAQRDSGEYGFFAFLDDLPAHALLPEGRWPAAAPAGDGAVEAAMLTAGVDLLGIHVGDRLWVAVGQGIGRRLIPVRIVGRWYPRDPSDHYWFNPPETYALALIIPEQAFLTGLGDAVPAGGREFTWYFEVDPRTVRASDAGRLAAGIARLRVEAQQFWRGLQLEAAPDDLLDRYQRQTVLLELLLLTLSAPLMLIILQFVSMAAGMRVEHQRGEIATLRGRGASTTQVLSIYSAEGILLGLLAVAAGPPLGALLAAAVGRLGGFFGPGTPVDLPIALQRDAFAAAGGAAVLALLAAVRPAWQAAGTSVVTYRQELARSLRAPVWQRAFLDLLPLPIAGYAYLALQQQRSVVPIGAAGDAVPDPLLLAAPALFILAATLLFLRLLPFVVRGAAWIGRWIAGPALLLALRQLARQPYDYRGLVLLLVMTLGLGTFSASAALTIDANQASLAAYQVGADLRLDEVGTLDPTSGSWALMPVGEYLRAPGVAAASRVIRVTGQQRLGASTGDLQILAVDPASFLQVATWRDDYADRPLVDLMSDLAAAGPGALLDRRLAGTLRIGIGDDLPLTINGQTIDVVVAGFADYFPTVSPDSGPFVIVTLDQLLDEVGPQPSEIWLRLRPGASEPMIEATLDRLGLPVTRPRSRQALVLAGQTAPSRQGVFGLLAVGFLVGAGLSILGFLVYSSLSFRRRVIQIGILRAIGLGRGQVVALFLAEQFILIAAGIGAGVLIGLAASWLYVPFLQLREVPGGPPTSVLIAWGATARLVGIVGAGLGGVLPVSLLLLRRVRLAEAIKLGEEQA